MGVATLRHGVLEPLGTGRHAPGQGHVDALDRTADGPAQRTDGTERRDAAPFDGLVGHDLERRRGPAARDAFGNASGRAVCVCHGAYDNAITAGVN